MQPLTYEYKMQVHRWTERMPFDLVLTRHPSRIGISGVSSVFRKLLQMNGLPLFN